MLLILKAFAPDSIFGRDSTNKPENEPMAVVIRFPTSRWGAICGLIGKMCWLGLNARNVAALLTNAQLEDRAETYARIVWSNLGAGQGWLGTRKRNRSNDLD